MSAKKIARTGLITALALILSYVEAQFPLSIAVPGVKLGIANLAVLFCLYAMGAKEAAAVSGLRVVLAAALFGSGASFFYAVCGAILSFVVMVLLKKTGRFGTLGVSMAGAVCHNIGQIAAAVLMTSTPGIVGYLPVLLLTGITAGAVIGILGGILVKRVKIPEN